MDIEKILKYHQETISNFIKQNRGIILKLTDELKKRIRSGATIFVAGNGGSMADSIHMVTELMGKFYRKRPPIKAISLGTNPALISAVSNDYSYENSFVRELSGLAQKGDIFIGISTSGKSKNILKTLEKAREIGCLTVLLTGNNLRKKEKISDFLISVPSDDVPRIQECHIFLIHLLCEILEDELYGN